MNLKDLTEANRAAWNEVTPIHQNHRRINLKEAFQEPGFSVLDETITAALQRLPIAGKRVAQLCCNNGEETLSLLNLGAEAATGFDISDAAIAEAWSLAKASGLAAQFVRTDVYDIDDSYNAQFDVVLLTIGAMSWLPDLERFFGVVHRLLRPGGHLVIYESHPFTYMLGVDGDPGYDAANPAKIVFSYFRQEPWVDTNGIDYLGHTTYEAKPCYSFTQTLSMILNAILGNGIQVRSFEEFPHDISNLFEAAAGSGLMPLCYLLVGQKPS